VYDVRQTEAIPRGENLDGGLVIATILLFSAFASFFLICFLAIQYR
jgi:hypothetical protein